jgi:hypothetical protein
LILKEWSSGSCHRSSQKPQSESNNDPLFGEQYVEAHQYSLQLSRLAVLVALEATAAQFEALRLR